ncbi:uroporphyrinogen-III synthase [Ferrovibrio sp.]|uniref:uroporphyrinogen-III synthase n=1 Tax=Ferrovibrio sp. TaxID=1917215 RepID=UPI003D0C6E8C
MHARLLLTRPEQDAARLRRDLEASGFAIDTAPLLRIQPLPAEIALDGIRGLLVTSANGLRAFTAQSARRDLTVYAVGEASARAASAAGFADVHAAGGDVNSLAALVRAQADPRQGGLLHVAGETLAGDLKAMLEAAGFQVARVTLYRAEAASALPATVAKALGAGDYDGVLFFSPRTAAVFAGLAPKMAPERITAYCLSAAVAQGLAGLPWRRVAVAASPSEAALLALLDEE